MKSLSKLSKLSKVGLGKSGIEIRFACFVGREGYHERLEGKVSLNE
jgi:hypothetical protein